MTTEKTEFAFAVENDTLSKQLSQSANTIKQLNAQILSCKQMVGEGLDQALGIRANLHLFQQENNDLKNQVKRLTDQVTLLGKKILELSPPKVESEASTSI